MSSETEREAALPGNIDQAIVSLRDAEWESGLHRDPLKSAAAQECDRALRSEIRAALSAATPQSRPARSRATERAKTKVGTHPASARCTRLTTDR